MPRFVPARQRQRDEQELCEHGPSPEPGTAPGALPLGRAAAPEEIAAPILFLCTPHAGFVTGEIFNVNGGAVLVG